MATWKEDNLLREETASEYITNFYGNFDAEGELKTFNPFARMYILDEVLSDRGVSEEDREYFKGFIEKSSITRILHKPLKDFLVENINKSDYEVRTREDLYYKIFDAYVKMAIENDRTPRFSYDGGYFYW